MLELSGKNFKAVIITMLNQVKENILVTNKKIDNLERKEKVKL